MLIMEEISRSARKIFQIQNVFFIHHRHASFKRENGRKKIVYSHAASKNHEREKKTLFGPLVETLPEKRKRFDLGKEDEIPKKILKNLVEEEEQIIVKAKKRPYKQVEMDFLTKNINRKNLNMIQLSSNKISEIKNKNIVYNIVNKSTYNNYRYGLINDEGNSKKLTTPSEMEDQKNEINVKEKILETNNDDTEKEITTNKICPSAIIIQNMLSFSIYDSTKSGRIAHNKLPVTNGIISLSAKTESSNKNLPSVTRILSATMSETAKKTLERWKAEMIEKLGIDGFNEYQQNLFKDGHDLHSAIENALLQKEYQIPEKVKPAFESVQNVLKDISSITALESHVVHPKLFYRGITDCVATYRGDLCLIDWKKSDKRKDTIESIYDAPTQVASYIGAINADLNYPFEIKKGLVVVAYTNGEEATVYEIDHENLFIYWKTWLKRLQKYFVETKKM
ncbi:mitochondrial genome maintenance exonuclease 1-like [Leptopilina boulardi]|uniref:mitochondrial genome maintenance exonuclease 1-like n=1 Tax=Leptopilina boulardi TaxID=63433 RepID=UPI0021F59C68|nr:mitochondrial genome maintenance exonuclease 1-like [Leptopilina boulardi]